jgi:hypothetical protein
MRNRQTSLAGACGLALLAMMLLLQASGMASTALAAAINRTRGVRRTSEQSIHRATAADGPIAADGLVYSLVSGPVYGSAAGPIYDLGAPTAEGTAVRVSLAAPTDQAMLTFSVRGPGPGYVALFVGDQWYDVDAALYRRGQGPGLIDGEPLVVLDRSERRRIQFMSPEDVLLPSMPPGDYVLVVEPKAGLNPELAAEVATGRDFLVRVAVGAPLCTLSPPNDQPTGTRPDDALYQFGLAVEPVAAGRGALLTFSAVVSPPFTDLFDFAWSVDGVPVDGEAGPIYQPPSNDLRPTPNGQHTIVLVARGAREYHDPTDPAFSHLPLDGGTVSVACTFGSSN